MDPFCNLCFMFVFVMLSCLFIAALRSPAGKGLNSWLSCVMFSSVFVTFPYGVPGEVWYLIASIPNHSLLLYFESFTKLNCILERCLSHKNVHFLHYFSRFLLLFESRFFPSYPQTPSSYSYRISIRNENIGRKVSRDIGKGVGFLHLLLSVIALKARYRYMLVI